MKKLYRFFWDCGRMGELESLFVAEEEDFEKCVGIPAYFGEVLGKHSEIEGTLDRSDFEVKSEDQEFIDKLVEIIGSNTISGMNPLNYAGYRCDDCGERELELTKKNGDNLCSWCLKDRQET